MKTFLFRLLGLTFLATACAGAGIGVVGDAARNPSGPDPMLDVLVVAEDDGSPIAGASLSLEEAPATDAAGMVTMVWPNEPMQFAISAPGFETAATAIAEIPELGPHRVALVPLVLEGTVVGPDDRPLPATTVLLNGRSATTNDAGRFALTRALPGDIMASRPAWEAGVATWDGELRDVTIRLEPKNIRALRVSGDKAANPDTWNEVLSLIENSAINAIVLDTKDESGWVFHETSVPEVAEIGALNTNFLYDVDQVLADMDALGLYKITRVTTFQDNFLPRAFPELGIRNNQTGEVWTNDKGIRWLDPTDRNAWEYPLALAVEACELGFDEIQFDYIRFPSDGDISTIEADGGYTEEIRTQTILAFLQEAHDRLNPMGCAVAADIFAITLTSNGDEGIGQRPELLSTAIDVLSPMIYTYTYGRGWNGFENPNEQPVEIVSYALDAGIPRLEGFSIYRPWIQTWQLNAAEIVSVQEVVEARDLGWMIWSANTAYDDSFLPEK